MSGLSSFTTPFSPIHKEEEKGWPFYCLGLHSLFRATVWVSLKVFFYFTLKNVFFFILHIYFTKYSHQSIYSTHLFNKIFILLQFFYYFPTHYFLSHSQHYQKNTKILYA